MSLLLENTLRRINTIRLIFVWLSVVVRSFRALLIGGTVLCIWASLVPDDNQTAVALGLLSFAMALAFQAFSGGKKVDADTLLVALDINNPNAKTSPYDLKAAVPLEQNQSEWSQITQNEVTKTRALHSKNFIQLLSSLPIPLLLFSLAFVNEPGAIGKVVDKVRSAVAHLAHSSTLTVISGLPSDVTLEPLELNSNKTHNIELLIPNVVEITVIEAPDANPLIQLVKRPIGMKEPVKNPVPYQSFRLPPKKGESKSGPIAYQIAFSISQDTDIYLSTLSLTKPIAAVDVRKLPVPEVSLTATGGKQRPWPDDRPFPVNIGVQGKNPLNQIRLIIKAEGRSSTEVVSNVLATDKKVANVNYDLHLDTYIQSDVSQVEIRAEAVDRAIPIPLVGSSKPLVVETISAYGRYRQTLRTLRELKTIVDEGVQEQNPKLDKVARETSKKAVDQASQSPFFDGLDRVNIGNFHQQTKELEQSPTVLRLMELQQTLNEFLFEHESLDDRERDRDFFVASRALSRLIETPKEKRAIQMEVVQERLKNFLEGRQKRWALRVKYLQKEPQSWPNIQKKPFQKALDKIAKLDNQPTPESTAEALNTLSSTVTEYRKWLSELENQEDSQRKSQEKKRQEGLSNARNQLKAIQKTQGKISKKLDKAVDRKESEMADQWPSTRMMQNSNIGKTESLEAQLRSLSPRASQRIKGALEAMKVTGESGNKKQFSLAESASDMAGRLLRQAQSAAQQSQRRRQRRQRRKRVSGDNYYGRQVIGRDIEIKRDYAVDKRYREEILEDISTRKDNTNDAAEGQILEDFLRKVVR